MVDWNNPKTLGLAISRTGVSLGAFADHAGVSRSQLYRLLAGDFKPRFETIQKIEGTLAALLAQKAAA